MTRTEVNLKSTPSDEEVDRIIHTLQGLSGVGDVVVETRARRVTAATDGKPDTTDRIIAALAGIDISATLGD